MADSETLEQLEQQVIKLSPQQQLQLVSFIVARLRAVLPPVPARGAAQGEAEAEGSHLSVDEAAELWE